MQLRAAVKRLLHPPCSVHYVSVKGSGRAETPAAGSGPSLSPLARALLHGRSLLLQWGKAPAARRLLDTTWLKQQCRPGGPAWACREPCGVCPCILPHALEAGLYPPKPTWLLIPKLGELCGYVRHMPLKEAGSVNVHTLRHEAADSCLPFWVLGVEAAMCLNPQLPDGAGWPSALVTGKHLHWGVLQCCNPECRGERRLLELTLSNAVKGPSLVPLGANRSLAIDFRGSRVRRKRSSGP